MSVLAELAHAQPPPSPHIRPVPRHPLQRKHNPSSPQNIPQIERGEIHNQVLRDWARWDRNPSKAIVRLAPAPARGSVPKDPPI